MIDEKDKIIIAHLMADCRISTTKLAKITNLSQPSIVYRIKNLEKKEYIDRYDVLLDYNKFHPLRLDNFMITVAKQKRKSFENHCISNKNIMNVFNCTHKYNYSVTIYSTKNDINKFENYLKKEKFKYTHFENIKSSYPTFSIFNIPIKINQPKYTKDIIKLDKNDIKILETLSQGGAKDSILDISIKTNISHDIVLYRYKKLKKAGYLPLFLAQINLKKFHLNYTILLFETINIPLEECLKKINHIKKTVWFGQINENKYIMTIIFKDYEEYNKILNQIYETFDEKLTKLESHPINNWLFVNRINLTKAIIK